MKTCSKCNESKNLDDFYKDGDGKQSLCKECSKKRVRLWSQKNKTRINVNGLEIGHNKNKNKKWRKYLERICRRCGFVPEDACQLTVDHIDRNKKNNVKANLQTLCHNCHNLKTKVELAAPENLLKLNLVPVPEVSGTAFCLIGNSGGLV